MIPGASLLCIVCLALLVAAGAAGAAAARGARRPAPRPGSARPAARHATAPPHRPRRRVRHVAARRHAKPPAPSKTTAAPAAAAAPPVASTPAPPTASAPAAPTASAPTASAPTASPPCKGLAGVGCATLFGFNTYTTTRTIAEQKSVGATVSRLFVDWALVEPSPGQWDWQQTDSEYAAMVAAGLHPLIVAFTAPCWARPSTDCSNPDFTGPPDPAYDQDWSSFISALTSRYPAALGIEIWNEPNLDQYFLPKADPARYMQLLSEAYTAVKAVDPGMPVVSGGLLLSPPVSGAGPVPGGYGADQFLAAMYADGAEHSMDALGVHIYPSDYVDGAPARWDPAAMPTWLAELESVRAGAGADTPIWITEMGVSTATEPGWPAAASPAQQAADLVSMIDTATADPSIQVVITHTLEDQTLGYDDADNDIQAGFGAFTSTGAPKPAACAISRAWGGSLTC